VWWEEYRIKNTEYRMVDRVQAPTCYSFLILYSVFLLPLRPTPPAFYIPRTTYHVPSSYPLVTSVTTVISDRAASRTGGPQYPVPLFT
jgi:hypothetical protein